MTADAAKMLQLVLPTTHLNISMLEKISLEIERFLPAALQ